MKNLRFALVLAAGLAAAGVAAAQQVVPAQSSIAFTSKQMGVPVDGKFDVAGKLTVKGTTKDVVVPIALAQAGPTTTASGAFSIKRTDFKIGEGEWADTSTVADDVQVSFKIALTGVGPL